MTPNVPLTHIDPKCTSNQPLLVTLWFSSERLLGVLPQNACLKGEAGVATCHDAVAGGPGNCAPCPQTPGSDCSRCDQVGSVVEGRYKKGPPFPPPCDGCEGVDWNGYAVKDIVEIPEGLPAGKYILGFRYDCEATAQVWSNCADVTLV